MAMVATATLASNGVAATIDLPAQVAQVDSAPSYATHDGIVSSVPVPWTPRILNGKTSDIAQVGDTMIIGGLFNQVSPPSGSPVRTQPNAFAFDATDGTIRTNFDPSIGGEVRAVEAGPTPGTVYVAGGIAGVNGQNGKIFLLNVSNGDIVSTFNDPPINGAVEDLALVNGTLYVGGRFTVVGGQQHRGIVALDAITGARDPKLAVQLTENQNWTVGSTGARGAIGAVAIDVDPTETTLAVLGNFRKADGLERRQLALIDVSGETAVVRADWKTDRFAPSCFSNAFDSYVRDVTFSPDGSYFNVATTGGPNPGTLCDTVTRWETADSGDAVQPTWTDDTGGDTLLSVASSGAAVYTGGHQRWMNNHGGRDRPEAGAVPRPGLAGVDANVGLPLSWNPGRNPRGVGAEAVYVTDAGLWVGSDTDWIGSYTFRRPRIAFFPLAGGTERAPEVTPDLAANVYLAGDLGISGGEDVLFRVNAGGAAIPAFDGGVAWAADSGTDSPWRNSGSNAAGWNPVGSLTDNVPGSTPGEIFSTERWDPGSAGDGNEMEWAIPIASGTDVLVRLYLSNRCTCTEQAGQRVYDISIEGNVVLDNYDIVADVGHDIGTMKEFAVTSDGAIDIDLGHVVENPLINGIEIVEVNNAPAPEPQETGLSRVWFDGDAVDAGPEAAPAGDVDWETVRGAVVIDDELYYVTTERGFYKRSFDGENYGSAEAIDPYNDPYWSDIGTGSGGLNYRGVQTSFYLQTPSLNGMAYQDLRLYYTRTGSNQILSREFIPESGVMMEDSDPVEGFNYPNVGGIFFDPAMGLLYFVDNSNGTLSSIAFADGAVSGSPTVVSGPTIDSMDWRAQALFVGPGDRTAVNAPPNAVGDISCVGLDCTFDGSNSSDVDGTISAYAWDFGDGTTSSNPIASNTFAAGGTFDVELTVSDNEGATDVYAEQITVEVANDAPVAAATISCDQLECTFVGSGSTDADGTVVSFAWTFGDGGTSADADTTHSYVIGGEYEVTLTVTDDKGAQNVLTQQILPQPNRAPEAVIAVPACDLLVCDFSGADSMDPDAGDSVVSYVWDFGDSTGGTGESLSHTFGAAGTYQVQLTVADVAGLTGTVTRDVTVSGAGPVSEAPQLVGVSASTGRTVMPSVAVPADVESGDLLVLFVTSNELGELTGPAGVGVWDREDRVVSGQLAVTVFTRVADGSEAGRRVTMTPPALYRIDMTMVAYRGVAPDAIEAFATSIARGTATHVTPITTSGGENRTELSFWADRSSSTNAWTAPAEVNVVSTQIGPGSGRVTTLVGEREVGVGAQGGLTATTNAASARSVTITIILAPA